MADYISREAVLALGYWHGERPDFDNPCPDGIDAVDTSDIETIPAADVVEVVRCGQCKYKRNLDEFERKYLISSALICTNSDFLYDGWNAVLANDFCSYGERK